MSQPALTPRQQREAQFYQRYAAQQMVEAVDMTPVQGREQRPWNPYWYAYEAVRRRYVGPWQRLLDFGCGIGIAAVRFAHVGYRVDGFDIAPANVEAARTLARRHQLESRCHFQQMAAEELSYPDHSFDLVAGIDILHHVDIPRAIGEIRRVLRPGGVAIFKEHVAVPVLDPIRNTALVRAIAPMDVSLDHHITEDERKLTEDDLDLIGAHFDGVQTQRFTLLSRFDRLIPGCGDAARGKLQRLDERLMRACPPLARLGGTVVLVCQKETLTGDAPGRG